MICSEDTVSRRDFFAKGAAFGSLVFLPGCFFPVGLILRGAATRAFRAGASSGGAASLASLGRGAGVATRAAQVRSVNLRSSGRPLDIVSNRRELLAQAQLQAQSSSITVGKRGIFRSTSNAKNTKDVGRLDHVDLHGNNVGHSRIERGGRVEHYTLRNKRFERLGFDILQRLENGDIVEHYNDDGVKLGSTEVIDGEMVADDAAEAALQEIAGRDANCPGVTDALDLYHSTLNE